MEITRERIIDNMKLNGLNIRFVHEVDDEIAKAAIDNNWFAFKFIINPSDDVCMYAIKRNWKSLKFIKEPTYEMQLEAVRHDGAALKYIKNTTNELYLEAINSNAFAIEFIENPTDDMCITAINKTRFSMEYIKNPSVQVCLCFINLMQRAEEIKLMHSHDTQVLLRAIRKLPRCIQYIDTSLHTREMIKAAVEADKKTRSMVNQSMYQSLISDGVIRRK